jgi:hypothetical protein
MNPKSPRFQQQQKQQTTEQAAALQTTHDFASPEEMLRHDAAQVEVPGALAHRVAESIAKEPKPSRSWWRKLFSRGQANG